MLSSSTSGAAMESALIVAGIDPVMYTSGASACVQ